jgi:hypothetical protein
MCWGAFTTYVQRRGTGGTNKLTVAELSGSKALSHPNLIDYRFMYVAVYIGGGAIGRGNALVLLRMKADPAQ